MENLLIVYLLYAELFSKEKYSLLSMRYFMSTLSKYVDIFVFKIKLIKKESNYTI